MPADVFLYSFVALKHVTRSCAQTWKCFVQHGQAKRKECSESKLSKAFKGSNFPYATDLVRRLSEALRES